MSITEPKFNTAYAYPFLDPDLPLETRVNDLVSRFTLEEKINLMCQYQDEVPRLGVKKYKHGTEAAHGMAWLGEATTFPQPFGLACTWDTELLRKVGSVIGDEARGFYRRDPALNGLTLWAPTVDMERDPRWGRTEEAYGEDPVLAGKLASALVQGMQGDHPFYVKAVASLKHFYGNNNEADRGECSVSIDPRNKREYYLKAFELPFKEGGALSMMTAYNSVNGVPANLNPEVNDIVKREWGMTGFVVSDAGDVLGTVNDHRYFESYKEAVAATIRAGIDSITDDADVSKQAIRDALAEGLLAENDLDVALRNAFRVRMRLGEFDPDERNPYAAIGESIICHPDHRTVSLEAARKNVVLLKNDRQTLPLDAGRLRKVAVIGPLADILYRDWYSGTLPYSVTPLAGIAGKLGEDAVAYASGIDRVRLKSESTGKYVRSLPEDGGSVLVADAGGAEDAAVLDVTDWGWKAHTLRSPNSGKYVTTDDKGLSATADEVFGWFTKEVFHVHAMNGGQVALTTWNGRAIGLDPDGGALSVLESTDPIAAEAFEREVVTDGIREAVDAARSADAAIVVVGNNPLVNGKETIDRPDLTLPESQERLIRETLAANPNTIVVVVGSYPFAIPWLEEHVPAILYTSHAGQELGNAVADVLFGDYAPAGRLGMTWYRSADQLPDIMDYDIIRSGRTYQYFEGDVLYPFGHGLTYTPFEYSGLTVISQGEGSGLEIEVRASIRNAGDRASDEVVQLYVRAGRSRVKRPLKQLAGFQRIHLAPGESKTLSFTLRAEDLAFWDVTREKWCVESGTYTLMLGRSSADIAVSKEVSVCGETIPPRNLRLVTRAANYDDYAAVRIGECSEGGDSLDASGAGAWVAFHDADLGAGVTFFEARIAADLPGVLEIRLDRPDGPLAGTCAYAATGGAKAWRTFTCAVNGASGIRDVYLTLGSEAKLSWFRFV
ncbi:carbohydrate-binding protein [Cohnella sp. CFH 77786]|uniref:glycoside hydrolase family 3 protein n=1 Tax=Cohnella sp. CFH 77786 TaxID=2662265 RepID=UPI001C60AB7D|nr:glycoside hydrolase family 3 protein [Cohnella sp. CFH 77786]MBW5448896.1 carbohydrate-binding protein [Cohnella sp. CFH 77786]